MTKLSVAIITRNEAANIGRCLDSLKWADEIVVLDGFSTDGTAEVCRKYTEKIYQKKFESFPVERDHVLRKTSNSWVLSVDADMYFPPELCAEIRAAVESGRHDAFLMRGLTVFIGGEIRHCGWFDPTYLRLFNKEKGGYNLKERFLDSFAPSGSVGKLENHFIHYGGDDFSEYFGKIRRYSYLTALEYGDKGVRINGANCAYYFIMKPMLIFGYKYIYKMGFLDGVQGLLVCLLSACTYFSAYATLWDQQRRGAVA
ncbi:MAG: hypothetical protein A2X32_06075 [Elusimicrobia bacterium GWC2_64_44]|nr:MAG: hypothetical protein A2X32_06075 [Elusimicrobia bacterium GWC2_64_44]